MSEQLLHRAERLKLARLLAVDVEELPPLETVPSEQLREFRERATDRLFDASLGALGGIGAASKLVPAAISATIAQKAFGPLLCARAAAAVDPGKAVEIAKRLSPAFLADTCVELDPRRVADIIARVPDDLAVPVAAELGRRGEHVTMGRFLAYVSDAGIRGAMDALSDADMLHTAFVLEHKEKLDHAVGLLDPKRMPGILRTASDLGLWPEALDLIDHLTEERTGPIADDLASLGPDVIAGLVAAVQEAGIWESLLPVVRLMSPDSRHRLAQAGAFHSPDVLGDIIDAAASQGLWVDLLPLLEALPDDVRGHVPALVASLPADLVASARAEAEERGLLAEFERATGG